MMRILNNNSPGKERRMLTRAIVVALRRIPQVKENQQEFQDLIVFIILSLEAVGKTIEKAVTAWEKRDYWVKADQFRMEWSWTDRYSKRLRKAYKNCDLASISTICRDIKEKLVGVEVSANNRIGDPWVGCRKRIK